MDPRTRMLLEAPVGRTIVRLALPNLVVMMVQTSIGLIETYFVAKLGVDALAAMALVFPPFMLLVMVSAGAMGGGILSAIARALGAGDRERANALVWHAVAITLVLSAATTVVALLWAPKLYALMGGRDGSLHDAVLYSNIIFIAAVPLWLFNSFAAMIRATGNMFLPAAVIVAGAAFLIPVSPMLIFGLGPLPKLGIAGGAVAVLIYYVVGCAIFAIYLWSGRGVLSPSLKPSRLSWAPLKEILRVGVASSVISLSTNVTAVVATGLAGLVGPAAVAGYGTGVRLEYMLVPLVFGLGQPIGAMVGTATGAANRARAFRVALIGAAIAGGITEAIGLAAALFPAAWLSLFGGDDAMLAYGSLYLRIVGPFYGFFGAGLALYFAAQGAGRLAWPMTAAILRVLISAGGGWLAAVMLRDSAGLFGALAGALVIFGLVNAAPIAADTWRRVPAAPVRLPQPS
ncbi:MAG TPA: MATE family efflux transporter [Pseudolabrys sp.]|nr:MATE family efflux transporter [Pseudolabrys sp.]